MSSQPKFERRRGEASWLTKMPEPMSLFFRLGDYECVASILSALLMAIIQSRLQSRSWLRLAYKYRLQRPELLSIRSANTELQCSTYPNTASLSTSRQLGRHRSRHAQRDRPLYLTRNQNEANLDRGTSDPKTTHRLQQRLPQHRPPLRLSRHR